jgi:hypothetical protein
MTMRVTLFEDTVMETQNNPIIEAYAKLQPKTEVLGLGYSVLTDALRLGATVEGPVTLTEDDIDIKGRGFEQYVGTLFLRLQYPKELLLADTWISTDDAFSHGTGLGHMLDKKLNHGTSTTH